jgi:hypothetical protein
MHAQFLSALWRTQTQSRPLQVGAGPDLLTPKFLLGRKTLFGGPNGSHCRTGNFGSTRIERTSQ